MKIKLKYTSIVILTLMAVAGGATLVSPYAGAITENDSAEAYVVVNDACEFDSDNSYTATFTALNGTSNDTETHDPLKPDFEVSCNNISGFSITAVGFSPDSTHASGDDGNTDMYSTTTAAVIPTGAVVTSGTFTPSSPSAWGMRISNITSSTSYTANSSYAIASHNYAAVPSATSPATQMVHYAGSTTALVTGTMRADYGFYISQSQSAGTYTGKVKYTVVGD